ncbi:PqqD family protein [Arenimonas sp. MALMAid1274]|uniref:PqqD family protein n=1 Tax=Arenimonas sp. MALMAid1274 TaxID=3411630 RepID=UPI003BA34380
MNSTAFDPGIRFARAPDALATEVDGEILLLSVDKGRYFSLTGVAASVWERLARPATLDELADEVARRYEVGSDTCRQDVDDFVQQLLQAGLAVRA